MNKPDIKELLELAHKRKSHMARLSGDGRSTGAWMNDNTLIALLEYVQGLENRVEFYESEIIELDDAIEEDFEEWKKERAMEKSDE